MNTFSIAINAFKENLSPAYFSFEVDGNNLYIIPVRESHSCDIVYGCDLSAVISIFISLLSLYPSQLSIYFDIKNYRFVVYCR